LKTFIGINSNRDLNNDEIQYAIALNKTDELIGDLYISKKGYMFELLNTPILWKTNTSLKFTFSNC
jgi:hypothetical protein